MRILLTVLRAKANWYPLFLIGISTISLIGCQTLTPQKNLQSHPLIDPPSKHLVTKQEPVKRLSIEDRLLERAEIAFRQGHYLPRQNASNAYDRFHSVLVVNADNKQARAGLQAIMLTYTDRVRKALSSGKLSSAKAILQRIEVYFPGNNLLIDLKKQILEQEKKTLASEAVVNSQELKKTEILDYEDFPLDPANLSSKAEETLSLLSAIAYRLKSTDESILIFARNDAEGRWIYKKMKQAAKGYRVRGDIRYSKTPKIRILPPL